MPRLRDRELARLIDEHQRTSGRVRRAVLRAVENAWERTTTVDDAALAAFVSAVVPIVEAGQRQVAAITAAQLTAQLEALLDSGRIAPPPVGAGVATGHRGVPIREVYARPIVAARTALARGETLDTARRHGATRAYHLASTDLQLARTHTTRAVMTAAPASVPGYRRVLQGPENCALCVVASTQRYRSAQLMPIHPGCDCTVAPLPPGTDGRVIDPSRLDEVTSLLEQQGVAYGDRRALANTKLTVRVNAASPDDVTTVLHGEIGPVLAVRQHRHTGASDLPARAGSRT